MIYGVKRFLNPTVTSNTNQNKENTTVFMKNSEYTEKMYNMLQDSVYRKLKRDTTWSTEENVKSTLNSPLKEHQISKRRFDLLKPPRSTPLRLYGLAKVQRRTFTSNHLKPEALTIIGHELEGDL